MNLYQGNLLKTSRHRGKKTAVIPKQYREQNQEEKNNHQVLKFRMYRRLQEKQFNI